MGDTLRALEAAYAHAVDWVESVPNRPVAAAATAEQLLTLLDGPLPAEPTDPAEVINMLAATAEKGLVAPLRAGSSVSSSVVRSRRPLLQTG
jgi:hypothetical protein